MFKAIIVSLLMIMALTCGFLIGAVFVLEKLGERYEDKEDIRDL